MDTNPGEVTDKDSIPDLTQRRNCAEDEESDDENDDEEDIQESLPPDMKGCLLYTSDAADELDGVDL
eukprot:9951775-Ditylum_brightwellii.AAC.1